MSTVGVDAGSPPEEQSTIWYIGQHESQRDEPVTSDQLRRAQDAGYDMLTTPITNEHFHQRVLRLASEHSEVLTQRANPDTVPSPLVPPLSPRDTSLTPEDSNSTLLGVTSPWIDLGSPDPLIARLSVQVLNLEIAYAAFCGIQNIIVQGPIAGSDNTMYARAMLEGLGMGPYINLHIQLPMTGESELEGAGGHMSELAREQYVAETQEDESAEDLYGTWDTWDVIRTLCNYSSRLSIALELPRQLPRVSLQSRWYSEPVRLLLLPRTSFLRNAKGYPVLHRQHQQCLTKLMRLRFPPWLLLTDVGPLPEPTLASDLSDPTPAQAAQKKPKDDPVPHLRYMRHLQQTQPARTPIERFGQGYQDYLQSPLQPLTDNLESITYEVFEKDPVKYEWYQRAIELALKDLHAQSKHSGSDGSIVVAIVGAGRGPLVTRALRASQSTGIRLRCWAVEKNPNAHVLLQRRNATDALWNKQVNVVKSDMRAWAGPQQVASEDPSAPARTGTTKVDILVSELLGSFADNELSPECLDGVQHVLHPKHGINIPQSYTAHAIPISAPRLQTDLLGRPGTDKWEIPCVVMLQQYDYLSAHETYEAVNDITPHVETAWSFSHPVPADILDQAKARRGGSEEFGGAGGAVGGDGSNEHNSRYAKLSFHCQDRGVCHGLAGYFETVLYAATDGTKVELSTNPVTMEEKSKDMISWFPIFFPLKTPLHVPGGADMEVGIWRQTDDRKVWYEWIVEVSDTDAKGGKRRLGVSELHSSRKNGCLM